MKTVLLALVLALVAATGAFAVVAGSATIDLYAMTNQICAPVIPFDPYPLYDDGMGGIAGCLAGWTDLYMGSDSIKKLDPTTGSEAMLGIEWGPDQGVLAGEGYSGWVAGYSQPVATPVKSFSFEGANIADTDLWISLPGMTSGQGGTQWIGITYPTDKTINYLDVVVTDGSSSYRMEQIADGSGPQDWINSSFMFLDRSTQSEYAIPWEWPNGPSFMAVRCTA